MMPSAAAPYKIGIAVAGLLLPAILIPVIALTGYSEVAEEVAKALVILFFVRQLPALSSRLLWTIIFALLFGFSENMFYLANFVQQGTVDLLWQRFAVTVPMHVVTAVILLFSCSYRKKYIVLGLPLAIFLHLAFNHFVGLWSL